MPQENRTKENQNKSLFINLVVMFATSTMQQLGKIINPVTGKTEINLESAQMTIDMLDMLEAKTRGNLDADEAKIINDSLASLKMNFVETAETAKPDETTGESPEKPAAPSAASTPSADEPAAAGDRVKYRKTYGEK
ncbi:MAG: DUF1844 domain-containing protein [Lentisphaerae bacterium]|nr:DUF1844 domain-containing protein [Lentisphaerota bacterium]